VTVFRAPVIQVGTKNEHRKRLLLAARSVAIDNEAPSASAALVYRSVPRLRCVHTQMRCFFTSNELKH